MTGENSPSAQLTWWATGSRPIWLVVVAWIACDFAAIPIIDSSFVPRNKDTWVLGLVGVVIGQWCFVALVSGLRWQTWSAGFAFGVVVVTVHYFALLGGLAFINQLDNEGFVVIGVLPALLLSLVSPLFIFRFVRDWRLTALNGVVTHREKYRIEDLFSLTAVVAASLVLLRIPPVVIENIGREYWMGVLIGCATVFGIGLLVLPICCWLTFGMRRRRQSLIGLLILGLAILGTVFGVSQVFLIGAPWLGRVEILEYILIVGGGAIATTYASLLFLAWCGLSLTRSSQRATTDEPALADRGDTNSKQSRSTRWLTAVAIAVAIICSISLARLTQTREIAKAEIIRLKAVADAVDGRVGAWGYQVKEIVLRERAQDDDFEQFRDCHRVIHVDLSNSSITDRGLAILRNFPQTRVLLLNGTQVTDDGLVALRGLVVLNRLDLSDTKVTASGILAAGLPHVHQLIVGFGQFTAEELQQLKTGVTVKVDVGPAPEGVHSEPSAP